MINKTTLIGHVGQEVEIRKLDNGTPVGRFSLATSESYKDTAGELQTETQWHNITVWRQQAELAEKLIKKGSLVYIDGKITYKKYTDKNGIERVSTDIVCNTFRLMGKKEGSNQSNDDSFPTNEPKAGAEQKTNDDDIFGGKSQSYDGLGNQINAPYSCNVCYKVKSGKYEGKEFDIQSITAEKIDFKFLTGEAMSFDKATFDNFFKICESSELPF